MKNYKLYTESFTVLRQQWHVHITTSRGPLMTRKAYYLLYSIWWLLLIPLTMVYFWKFFNLDSVSVEQSYLADRNQSWSTAFNQNKPSLVYGVRQGSVFGPIIFTIYMLPLGDIIKRREMQFHMYADDCQLYTTFEASEINPTSLDMEILIDNIHCWYSDNMLKPSDSKPEVLVIKSKFRPSVQLDHIRIGESSISTSETVRNMGVFIDSKYNYWTLWLIWCPILTINFNNPFLVSWSSSTTVDDEQMNHP